MTDRKLYKPPLLRQLSVGPMGKHDVVKVKSVSGDIVIPDLDELLQDYGSPLFIVYEELLRSLYNDFLEYFSSSNLDTRIAYSYKTNYLPAVCSVFAQEGAFAEVVSGMEYNLARALGVPGSEIVFNGPYKTREQIDLAITDRALINVDGFDDLALVEASSRSLRRKARIGLRINFRAESQLDWAKFGFSIEQGEVDEVLKKLVGSRYLSLEALHNHCGTFNLEPSIYERSIKTLISVARTAHRLGLEPHIFDLGGGFPSDNILKSEFAGTSGGYNHSGTLNAFADAILKPLNRARKSFGPNFTLMLEPGRAIVDSAVQLACTVVAAKEVSGENAAIVDAGVNILPTAYWYDHPVHSIANGSTVDMRPVTIYGPLCMQIDRLRKEALLPPLKSGMRLIFRNVGAYCLTQSMQFIQPRPAVVMLGSEGPMLIRRREEWRDIFTLDSVPKRLRRNGYEF
jgi:diaminopimelate decarboxylase